MMLNPYTVSFAPFYFATVHGDNIARELIDQTLLIQATIATARNPFSSTYKFTVASTSKQRVEDNVCVTNFKFFLI